MAVRFTVEDRVRAQSRPLRGGRRDENQRRLERNKAKVSETAVSFSVEQELSRMVVAVRAVGSDEVIRQFPPEEFITVAKFIAAQNPEMISENYLKGILFDQYT